VEAAVARAVSEGRFNQQMYIRITIQTSSVKSSLFLLVAQRVVDQPAGVPVPNTKEGFL